MILYDFVKLPQFRFAQQLPLRGSGTSLPIAYKTSAGASPCPTLWDIIFHSVRSTCFFSLFTLNFSLFSARQWQGLSLRYVVVCFVSLATAFGCLSLTMQLLLFRKNHARLACSVVNALTTARCRYQLLRFADNRISASLV